MATEYSGINYFPVQATFFEGNVQELLEAKHGIKGPYLMMQLLCKIYKEGYYLAWGEEQSMILSHKLGKEFVLEEVNDMMNLLLEKGFFDKESYEKYHILTSGNIQRVWMEATNRRKRDLAKLPYLLIDIPSNKENNDGKQRRALSGENVDIFSTQVQLDTENADISRQSKGEQKREEQKKELPPSIPQGKEDEDDDDSPLPLPPEYALDTKTHNYTGMLENLKRLNITDRAEIKAIIRLSNYGEKGKPFWKLLVKTDWKKITTPGRYIIKSLRNN